MPVTPPGRTTDAAPPTPRHGAKFDTFLPYATRQKTRSTAQHAVRTPSPAIEAFKSTPRLHKESIVHQPAPYGYSPPSSTQTSPQDKITRKPRTINGDLVKHRITKSRQTRQDSPPLEDTILVEKEAHPAPSPAGPLSTAMLPTPAKTPRKKPVQPAIGSAARILFHDRPENVEDLMPTPRRNSKRSKKTLGFSLGSFDDDVDTGCGEKIEIFTDSKEKVPEIDESEDNPFYEKPGQNTVKSDHHAPKPSKRRKIRTSKDDEMAESFKRADGLVYVL